MVRDQAPDGRKHEPPIAIGEQVRREADPVRFPDVSLAVVKLLGSGEYVLERPGQPAEGHFGLAVTDYVHATAPNRRFPDLVTQRFVKAALGVGSVPYGSDEVRALAAHCTAQEDAAPLMLGFYFPGAIGELSAPEASEAEAEAAPVA